MRHHGITAAIKLPLKLSLLLATKPVCLPRGRVTRRHRPRGRRNNLYKGKLSASDVDGGGSAMGASRGRPTYSLAVSNAAAAPAHVACLTPASRAGTASLPIGNDWRGEVVDIHHAAVNGLSWVAKG